MLKHIIINHKAYFLTKKKLVSREIIGSNRHLIDSREVVFITGIRRSGKSSLMRLFWQEITNLQKVPESNILFINFEDERLTSFTINDFDVLIQTWRELENPIGKIWLFLDEIQYVQGWERWINRLYEFEDVKIFITGSNASMLHSEISSLLTGRNRQITLSTFSFPEYLQLHQTNYTEKDLYKESNIIALKRHLSEYLVLGGFPEVLKTKDITLLDQYFKDIIYRDIVNRYGIKNVKEIRELCLYLISNPGTIASYATLTKMIGLKNITTVKNYLEMLEDVFLIKTLSLFDFSVKKQIYNPDKFYISDIGFHNALGFKFSNNIGHLLENVVFNHLTGKYQELFYWKSLKGNEVDFIIKEGLKPTYAIQVCKTLNKENEERETAGLLAASEELKISNLLIITEDQDTTLELGSVKIRVVSILKWLLTGDW